MAGKGVDTIEGNKGDDGIRAGAGDDTIFAGNGDDRVLGGNGDDGIRGGRGTDVIDAENGDDRVQAGNGNDIVDGGRGDDRLRGQMGDDHLSGGDDDDRLTGGKGADRLDGGDGSDVLSGDDGDDELIGGAGNDDLRGAAGNDVLDGGSDIDVCTGDDGVDMSIACEGMSATTEATDADAYVSPTAGAVALTFDDGPHPSRTPIVLDILDEYGIKATFFVVGWRVDANPELTAEIARRGHSVQNHAYSHQLLTAQSSSYAAQLISNGADVIEAKTGVRPTCLRPPWGSVNDRIRGIADELDQAISLWEVDSRDYASQQTNAIIWQVLQTTDAGEVVLMHDTIPATGRALPAIVEGLRDRGFTFETICDATSSGRHYDEMRRHQPQ